MKTLLSLIGTISIIGSGTTNAALLTSQNNNPKVAKGLKVSPQDLLNESAFQKI